ncbi:trypsin-like peptidase domain-containing protein [Gemella morbillorum]|uniref:Trypsin-like serine protease n=1 Tax=Gemella morbillorum TaxID=29391 RepID=A0AAP9HED0_9BACL|nr:trypsin-like peptidase domain-containing protein [Gemella morbillorum]EFV35947.1 YSIRK family Gram-positive signal peptide [Gemella morbillorum M424]QGS09606.1 trypsin-like serine protease [Gemella morbillorum]
MKNFFGEKYSRFAIRKFTIGIISATLGMFILDNTQISDNYAKAEDKLNIHYRYVSDDELTQKEKELIVKELPKVAESNEETYYLVYKPSQQMKLSTLPNTGIHTGVNGILLAGVVGMLVVAVTRGKNKKYKVLSVMLVTSLGISILQSPVIAMDSLKLSVYNTDFSVLKSGKLPNPLEIPGYNYVGFIKNEYTNFKINKTDKALENIRNSDSSEGSRNRNIIKPEYKGEQSGAIVAPEKVEKPEYKGEQSGAIVAPEKVEKLEYKGEQSGAIVEPEKLEKPEYTGEQSGAIVEPEKLEKPEYTGEQSGAIVEPEKLEKPEYKGEQSGAIVEPEKIEKPEYTGEQSGAIVEPEKLEKPEYTEKIEPLKPETDKLPKENIMEKNASAMLNMRFISNNIENSGVGSATFISPNVLLSVAHNFITSSKDNMTGELIGSEKENIYEWITPDGKKGTFSAKDIHFYNKKEYPKGYINDLAVIKLPNVNNNQYVSLTSNYNKVNVGDKLNVYGYPKGKYTHLKDVSVELEQQYAKNTYGVQYQGGAPGMSGGGILNDKGEVIGIHQNGGQNRSGGLILSPNQLEWIKSIIEGKEITPKYDEIERPKEDKKEEKYQN